MSIIQNLKSRLAGLTSLFEGPTELEQRLLAEAVRLHEDARGEPIHDPAAEAAAGLAAGDWEQRVISRAGRLAVAPALRTALHQLYSALRWITVIGVILIAFAGSTTARVTLGAPHAEPVINFFWIVPGLLGLPTLTLLIWLSLMFLKPASVPGSSLGGAILTLARWIDTHLHRGPLPVAAARAVGVVYSHSTLGRWTLSAVVHLLWLGFLTGCLVMVILLLSTHKYTFAWETTILSDQTYINLTRAIAALPDAFGFPSPDAAQITASHWTGEGTPLDPYREAWAGLLIGSILVYGLLPRLLALIVCLIGRQRAARRFRLDPALPGYARLQARLLPAAREIGVVDPDRFPEPPRPTAPHPPATVEAHPFTGHGPALIMGYEVERPGEQWPPALNGVDWVDLGFIEGRSDRRRVLEQVQAMAAPLRVIAVVCSVTTTPDRGVRGFLHEMRQATPAPVLILLTDGQRLRERGHPDEVEQRFADWRALAAAAEVTEDHVLDLDLNHLTVASRARLTNLLNGRTGAAPPAAGLERAFAVIVAHARQWSAAPAAAQQAELHRAIAALYQNRHPQWQALLHLPPAGAVLDSLPDLQTSAQRMLRLLPERLRHSPRWYAAGAAAGALSCVAAATLVAPAAIATLPLWAGLGAALAAVAKPPARTGQSSSAPEPDLGAAVSSAALFALVLELQGEDEVTITRLLDRVADDEPPVLHSADAAATWLDLLRQRFTEVRTAEVTA